MALTFRCRWRKTEAFILSFVQGIRGWANTPSQGHRDWTESPSHGKEDDLPVYTESFLISVEVKCALELELGLSLELVCHVFAWVAPTPTQPMCHHLILVLSLAPNPPDFTSGKKKKSSFYSPEILMCFYVLLPALKSFPTQFSPVLGSYLTNSQTHFWLRAFAVALNPAYKEWSPRFLQVR